MAPYPESESMAIKRIRVALKKKNWELFDQGIYKTRQMFNNNHKWLNTEGWQELMDLAETEYVPSDLWDKFSNLTQDIIKNAETEDIKNPLAAHNDETEWINTLSQSKVAIFYNQLLEPVHCSSIKKHRITLNNLMHNNNKYSPEPKWFEDLSRLVNNIDKPSNDLVGFLSLVSLCRSQGTIISSSYDANIIKAFVKSNIEFSIPDVKISLNPDKNWEIYPLGGLACCYICLSCGHTSLNTNFSSRTIVGSCSRCSNPTYPDILDISNEKVEVNPKIWYQAFAKLSQASTWILINPPAYSEQPMVRDLIKDAASVSRVERVYVITIRAEIGNWWANKLAQMLPNAEVKNNYPSITSLLDDFKEVSVITEEVIDENIAENTEEELPDTLSIE